MKMCTNCHKVQQVSEFREKCGDQTLEFFMCKQCRDRAERKTIRQSTRWLVQAANHMGIEVEG